MCDRVDRSMSKLQSCEDANKRPLAIVVFVMSVAFWSMTILPRQKVLVLHDDANLIMNLSTDSKNLLDCDVCVVAHLGDDGTHPPSASNLPFPLLHKLFEAVRTIQKKNINNVVCVAVDHPAIACLMVRDALGPDASCWPFQQMPMRETPVRCNHMVVGKTSRYLPQLVTIENQTGCAGRFEYQQMHVVDLDAVADSKVLVTTTNIRPTVVTGFSANHLSAGLLLLRSIATAAFTAKQSNASFAVSVVVWAMEEFRGTDRDDLHCVVKELKETWGLDVEVRAFKFWQYPEWMRIKQTRAAFNEFGTGEYAWKVVMIHTVLMERGLVLWTDAGDRFKTTESLTETLAYVAANGFASRSSSGSVAQWTHPGTLRYLRATLNSPQFTHNCDGSAVGFSTSSKLLTVPGNYSKSSSYWELARPWYECAMTRQCIAPQGSNRTNHRQDQAALTVLAALRNFSCRGVHGDVGLHMDYDLGDVVGAAPSSCYHDPRRRPRS